MPEVGAQREPETEPPPGPEARLRDGLVRALVEQDPEGETAQLLTLEPGGAVLALPDTGGPLFLLVHPGPGASEESVARHAVRLAGSSQARFTHVAIVGGPETLQAALKAARPHRLERKVAFHQVLPDGTVWSAGGRLKVLARAARTVGAALLRGELPPSLSPAEIVTYRARFRQVAEAERAFASAVSRRRPIVTMVLVGLNLALFGLELLWGGSTAGATLHRMGANGPAALAGEPWRLLASAFLHFGPLHLGLNLLGLWLLGGFVERLLGPARFTVLYAASALAGGVASAALSPGRAVGASGAIFGLLAATLALAMRRGVLPPATRVRLRSSLTPTLLINVACSFLPQVDLWAHLGGAAAGAALGLSGLLTRPNGDGPVRLWRLGSDAARLLMAGSIVLAFSAGQPWLLGRAPALEPVALGPALELELPAGVARLVTPGADGTLELSTGTLEDDGFVVAAATRRDAGHPLEALLPGVAAELPEGARFVTGPSVVPVGGRPTLVATFEGRGGLRAAHWVSRVEGWLVRVSVVTLPDTTRAWAGTAGEIARSVRARPPAPLEAAPLESTPPPGPPSR